MVVVVEAEEFPPGGFRSIHSVPLVSQEPNLEKEKEVIGQFDDKAWTDAEIMVVAGNGSAIIGPSSEVIADIGKEIREKGREGCVQSEIGVNVNGGAGFIAAINHEPTGNTYADVLVHDASKLRRDTEDVAASPGVRPADADAGVVPALRKDAFVGAPQVLAVYDGTYTQQGNNKDELFHKN